MLFTDWLKEKKKPVLLVNALFLLLLISLIVLFTFYDRQFSAAVYHKDSIFGVMFEMFGFLPAIIVDAILFMICYRLVQKKGHKVLFHIITAACLIGGVVTVFISFEPKGAGSAYSVINYSVSTVTGIGLSFAMVFLFRSVSPTRLKKLLYIFLIAAIMATLSVMIVYIFKPLWGRWRYHEVLSGKSYSMWLRPQGPMNGESFPSAHAMSACSAVVLFFIAWRFQLKKRYKFLLGALAVAFIFCVSFSRIVIGWHYATDTLFSILFSYICLLIGIAITDTIYRRKQAKAIKNPLSEDGCEATEPPAV